MGIKLTNELVIKRFKSKWLDWKNRYDYSNVHYINQNTKVEIQCLKKHWKTGSNHGKFEQKPIDHWLGKQGCKECKADNKREIYLKDEKQFIKEARTIHEDFYNYRKVKYHGAKEQVLVICPIHGDFRITPDSHLNAKVGCAKCGDERGALKNATKFDTFKKRAVKVHQNKYTYLKESYQTGSRRIKYLCPKHGLKTQIANVHAKGHGCSECANETNAKILSMKQEMEFTSILKAIYKDQYEIKSFFLKSNLTSKKKRRWASLVCKEHGNFEMPCATLKNQGSIGCKICKNNKISKSNLWDTNKFIAKAVLLHGNKYDYSITKYKNMKSIIRYICPKHGEREQVAGTHLRPSGCRKCADEEIVGLLKEDSYKSNEQYGIYLLKIKNSKTKETYLKVGLTKTTIKQRMGHLQKDYQYEILAHQIHTYSEVFNIAEKEWIKEIKQRGISQAPNPKLKSGGNNECAVYNDELAHKYANKINNLLKSQPIFVFKL